MTALVPALAAALSVAALLAGVAVYLRAPAEVRAADLLAASGSRPRGPGLGGAVDASPLGRRLGADLARAGMTTRPSSLLAVIVVVLVVALVLLPGLFGPTVGTLLALVAATLPYVVVRRRAGRHAKEFAAQLPAVLDLLASALRAGQSEAQAFGIVADEMKGAAHEEFDRMRKALALGSTVEAVTGALLERLPGEDLELVVDAITLAHRVGGNLADMLAQIATLMRDRTRLEGETRALTAQGRAATYFMTALAPIGLLIINFINPSWGAALFDTALGRIVLIVALVLEVLGFVTARRASAVDV